MKNKLTSLSRRLLISLGAILILTQSVTITWLLHEDRELLTRTLRKIGQPESTIHLLHGTNREMLGALLIPTIIELSLSLFTAALAIGWIVAPLKKLTEQLQQRSVEQWQPFEIETSSNEVLAITQALNGLMLKLQMAFQRERQFTADVSHELRTPIAGIRLNLELLALQLPEEVNPLIDRLDSMQNTINQLLTMARLEQKMVMGLQTRIDLIQDVIVPSRSELEEVLSPQQQKLKIDTDGALGVIGDKTLLRMLLRNLIENSSRYADHQSEVSICATMENQSVKLTVKDIGIGVDESQIKALTNAFQRFDQRGNGAGLGLNIVARICALHNAQLQISNHHDPSGLSVEITFPALK